MLISFSLQNWMSFKEKATLSMVASRQTTFSNRLARIGNRNRILPIAAIYGGNASGKSNISKALEFAKNFIVNGVKKDERIGVIPFALCKETRESPSDFYFQFSDINQNIYEYFFSVDKERVHKEKLTKLTTTRENVLFERVLDKFTVIENDERLKFTSVNTLKNKLFLTNTIEQNQHQYESIYSWFSKALKIITPKSLYMFEELSLRESWLEKYAVNLKNLDTGISRIEEENVEDSTIPQSKDVRYIIELIDDQRFIEHEKDGKKEYKKLVTYHTCKDGEEVKFELDQESDGTIRLMDILPAFIFTQDDDFEIIIIDEIERSLHHMLVKKLLENYLRTRKNNNRKQIIFTTHDLLLMDQELMRRDEMFLVERNSDGESSIQSISDYKNVRIDKDLKKNYLLGRFGGIPKI
jgi:uncharacterized protein